MDRVPTGGSRPISLSLYQDLLYVVHQGSDDVTGFTVDSRGHLLPIPGSKRALSNAPGANAAQVEFSTDGDELVVTQRGKNGIIDVFLVDKRTGLLSGAIPNSSNSREPFGMAFDNRENLLVAEGNFVIPSAGTVSSYNVLRTGMLQTVSPAVANGGNDTCWIVITNNSRFAYVQSFGDSRISSYTIQPDGTIVLLQSAAGSSGPLGSPGGFDLALNIGSQYLYALNQQGTISAFAVQPDGTLTPLGQVTGLPPSTVGLAAR